MGRAGFSKASVFLGSLLLAAAAQASGVRITPVVIEMPSARQPGVVSIANESDRPKSFQAQALIWFQEEGRERYEPTSELMVVPPIAEIPPGGSQMFRVMLRQPSGAPSERTYRLVLEDITADAEAATNVALRYVHNLPVLVAPAAKTTPLVRWKPCADANPGPTLCVRLQNAGNRRIKLQKLQLAGAGWERTLDLQPGVNVLAGAEREWRLQAGSALSALERVQVEATDAPGVQTVRGAF